MGAIKSDRPNLASADFLGAIEYDKGRRSAIASEFQQKEATAQDAENLARTPLMRPKIIDHPHSEPAPSWSRSSLENPATSELVTAEDDIALLKKPRKSKQTPAHSDRVLRSSKLSSSHRNAIVRSAHIQVFGGSESTVSTASASDHDIGSEYEISLNQDIEAQYGDSLGHTIGVREEEKAAANGLCQSFKNLDIEDDLSTDTDSSIGESTPASSITGNPIMVDYTFFQCRTFPKFEKYKDDLSSAEIKAQILQCLVKPAITKSEINGDYRMEDGHIYLMRISGLREYVKIGLTTRPAKRLWEHLKCGYNMESEFFEAPCCQKLESIVKLELHNKRYTFPCFPRGEKHGEWFMMDYQEAKDTVQKWCRWMKQQPYGADSLLKPEWQERISGGVRDYLGF